MVLGEKLITDYTTRKKELTAKGIVRCPKCGEIGLKSESDKYLYYTHRIYSTPIGADKHESCIIKKKDK